VERVNETLHGLAGVIGGRTYERKFKQHEKSTTAECVAPIGSP
jgi:hypothetical protein